MKKVLSQIIIASMIFLSLSAIGLPAAAAMTGSGTELDPYIITTGAELLTITGSNYYKFGNNIELTDFSSIATFAGVLDGDSKTLTITNGTNCFITNLYGTVKNLSLNGNFTFTTLYRGILAEANLGTISNCVNNATITGSATFCAAFVGANYSIIENCFNYAELTFSGGNSGGIVGINEGTVKNCGNQGTINGNTSNNIGGIIGRSAGGTIDSCYNTGKISAASLSYVGGITSYMSVSECTITNCFNSGDITGGSNSNAAGIAGTGISGSSVSKCYNTGLINSGNGYSISSATNTNCFYLTGKAAAGGATALTEAQMKSQASFANFDFTNIWGFNPQGDAYVYPQLKGMYFTIESPKGTKNNPYKIPTEKSFAEISGDNSAYYILTDNIELTGSYTIASLAGGLDGGGKTITIINGTNSLFTEITATAEIKDLTLSGNVTLSTGLSAILAGVNMGTISGCNNTATLTATGGSNGVFAGENTGGTITGCINDADISFGSSFSGAIAGYNAGTISGCGNLGNITITNSSAWVGGIVGLNYGASFSSCFNRGNISVSAEGISPNNVAGIAGENRSSDISFTNCFNAGNITINADKIAGGIVGHITNKTGITFDKCYNSGVITAGTVDCSAAAAIYNNTEAATVPTITSCYYLAAEGTGKTDSTSLTSAQMKSQESFTNFDFTDIWGFNPQGKAYVYPQLKGMYFTAEYVEPINPVLYEAYVGDIFVSKDTLLGLSEQEKSDITNKNVILAYADLDTGNDGYVIKEFGFVFSPTVKDPTLGAIDCYSGNAENTDVLGNYGVLYYGSKVVLGNYYVKPYVIYTKEGVEEVTLYGTAAVFATIKIKP